MRNKYINLLFAVLFLFSIFLPLRTINGQDIMRSDKLAVRAVYRKLPAVYKRTQKRNIPNFSSQMITNAIKEDFELDDFPRNEAIPDSFPYSQIRWGRVSDVYHLTYSHSIWCAAEGGDLTPLEDNYENNMRTAIIFTPIDLSNKNWAKLRFSFFLDSELYHDFLHCLVSNDGENFFGIALSGSTEETWQRYCLDLSNVPGFGNATEYDQIWLAFEFISNESITGKGAFLDDIWLDVAETEKLPVEKVYLFSGKLAGGATWDGANLWLSDTEGQKILKIDERFDVLSEYNSPMDNPADLAWDGERLWIAYDSGLLNLQMIPAARMGSLQFPIKQPYGLTFWNDVLYISDLENNAALYTFQDGSFDSIAINAMASARLTGLACELNAIWCADSTNSLLYKFIRENDSLICIGAYEVPGTPLGIADDERNLYYLSHDSIYQVIPPRLNVQINQVKADSFPKILLFASVTNDNDDPINNLTKNHFSVYEDDVLQLIDSILPYAGNSQLAFALVLDNSGSMGEQGIADMKTAAKTFVELKSENDLGAVFKFKGETWKAQGLTNDKSLLINAIDADFPWQSDSTALYDAIYLAGLHLESATSRRAIIAITDGQDNKSSHSLEEMIQFIINKGTPVFMIGLGNSVNEEILRDIASQTNGHYYYAPKSDTLDDIYINISQVISNQYKIKYTTNNSIKDSSPRHVKLVVSYDYKSGYGNSQYYSPFPSPSNNNVFVWINDQEVVSGQSFRIPVKLLINERLVDAISSLYFSIGYDSSVLAMDSISTDSSSLSSPQFYYSVNDSQILATTAMAGNFPQGDTLRLFDLIGNAIDTTERVTTLKFVSAIANEGYPSIDKKDGHIKIISKFNISGYVGYYSSFLNKPIDNVNMKLIGSSSYSSVTNESGYYHFDNVRVRDLSLTASKEIGRTMAVFSYDAALILNYIVDPANNELTELQKFVGDVTENCGLTAFDAANILKYVVNLPTSDAPDIGKFFFVPKDSIELVSFNPCYITHAIDYMPLNTDYDNQNFCGYVLGDVSGNWNPNTRVQPSTKARKNPFMLDNVFSDSANLSFEFILDDIDQQIYSIQGSFLYPHNMHFQFFQTDLDENRTDILSKYNDTGGRVIFAIISANGIKDKTAIRFVFSRKYAIKNDLKNSFKITELMINESFFPDVELNSELGQFDFMKPDKFRLKNAFPNPFNSKIMIKYEVPKRSEIELAIFNIRGQKVKELIHEIHKPGFYHAFWDGTDTWKHSLPSGVYILNLKSGEISISKKMILVR